MLIKTEGIVLKKSPIGEEDKIITILTKEYGVIEAGVKRARSKREILNSSCEVTSAYEFVLYKGQKHYFVNSTNLIINFKNIRIDAQRFALAGYFCELAMVLKPSAQEADEITKLLLNAFYLLDKGKYNIKKLKSIFELRIASLLGFMPNLVGCNECNEYIKPHMLLIVESGYLLCSDCLKEHEEEYETTKIELLPPVLHAIRHIVFSAQKKLYNFEISDTAMTQLCQVTEFYVLGHLDSKFQCLDIYNAITATLKE